METGSDFEEVFLLYESAFGQDNEARLVEQLRISDAFIPGLSLVAENDGKIAGHIFFSGIKIRNENKNEFESLALAPMAVVSELRNRGIGGMLITHGLTKARELGYSSVIVLGHENYYPRFGFKPAAKWHIYPPFNVKPEVFMAVELVENGLKGVSGTVQYPPEFDMVK